MTGPITPRKGGVQPPTPRKDDGRCSTSTTPRKEGRWLTTPRTDQRRATPRKMTPRKAPGNATPPAIRQLRRDSKIITTLRREEFKIKVGDEIVKKKMEPNQVNKIEKVDDVGDIGAKSKSGLRNEGSGEDKGEKENAGVNKKLKKFKTVWHGFRGILKLSGRVNQASLKLSAGFSNTVC